MDNSATWLDQLNRSQRDATARQTAVGNEIALWGARFLSFATFFVLFVGINPLAQGGSESAGGDLKRQVLYLFLGAVAAVLILMRWQVALHLLARAWALLLVYAAMAMTTIWSAYPGVTLRRFFVFVILLMVATALASNLRNPRQYLAPVLAVFALTLFADFAVTIALPGRAFTDIGLAGLHTDKNAAGMRAQTMAIVFASCLIAVRNPAAFWSLVMLTFLTFVFLALTLDKTSAGLTVLSVFVFLPLFVLSGRSHAIGLLAVAGAVALAGAITLVTGAFDLTFKDWAQILTGDPSFTGRDGIWEAVLTHIGQRPYFGYGFGAQWSMQPLFHPLWLYQGFWTGNQGDLDILRHSHNGYLDLFVHGGFFLASIVGLFLLRCAAGIGESIANPSHHRWFLAGAAMFAVFFLSVVLSNLTKSTLFFPDGILGQLLILFAMAHHAWRDADPSRHG